MWYYAINRETKGPLDENGLMDLLRRGIIDGRTRIWRKGLAEWVRFAQSPLSHLLANPGNSLSQPTPLPLTPHNPYQPSPAAYQPAPAYAVTSPLDQQIQGLESTFKWMWILLLIGILTFIILIGIFALIAACVLNLILIYKLWDSVQDKSPRARTTPGMAVALGFIPLFNIYWIFVVISGLAKDQHEIAQQRRTPGYEDVRTFALLSVILSLIPFVNLIGGIMMIVAMGKLTKNSVAILRQKAGQTYGQW